MPQDGVRTFLPLLRLAAQQPAITRPARYVHYTYALRNPVLLSDIVIYIFRVSRFSKELLRGVCYIHQGFWHCIYY